MSEDVENMLAGDFRKCEEQLVRLTKQNQDLKAALDTAESDRDLYHARNVEHNAVANPLKQCRDALIRGRQLLSVSQSELADDIWESDLAEWMNGHATLIDAIDTELDQQGTESK